MSESNPEMDNPHYSMHMPQKRERVPALSETKPLRYQWPNCLLQLSKSTPQLPLSQASPLMQDGVMQPDPSTSSATTSGPGSEAEEPQEVPKFNVRFKEIVERADDAGLENAFVWRKQAPQDHWLELNLRSGRNQVQTNVRVDDTEMLASYKFEQWSVIDGYHAILDPARHEIVAAVEPNLHPSRVPGLSGIPLNIGTNYESEGYELRLDEPSPGLTIKLSDQSPGDTQLKFLPGAASSQGVLQIGNVSVSRHDQARDLLVRLTSALFFNLDLAYGVTPSLRRREEDPLRRWSHASEMPMTTKPPVFPTHQYPEEPLSLYLHAYDFHRGFLYQPLSAYLTYYQTIEFFLPKYARADTIRQFKLALKDPRLNSDDDHAIARLITIVDRERQRSNELDQLVITIAACCPIDQLADLLTRSEERRNFLSKGKVLRGVPKVDPRSKDLASDVARRIYAIRCRIVHSKESSDDAPPILPFSKEASELHHDIALVRFVAQQVLVASGESKSW